MQDETWPLRWYEPIRVEVPVCNCGRGKGQLHCHPGNGLFDPLWAVPKDYSFNKYVFEIIPRPRQCRHCDQYHHFAMAYHVRELYWQCERCHDWINGLAEDMRNR